MDQHISIVIVNYRTASYTISCLRSIVAQGRKNLSIYVVDNDSPDDSVVMLGRAIAEHGWSPTVTLLPQARNGGFAYGCNAGVRAALQRDPRCPFVLFVNPDTELRAGAIDALSAFLETHPDAGIVGCSVESPEGDAQRAAHAIPSPLTELDAGARLGALSRLLRSKALDPTTAQQAFTCDWVSGACFAVRREVFEQIGLLDEGFFLYFEEVDFCRRASRAGWKVYHLPHARVMHVEGAATQIRNANRRRPAYWFASRRRFFLKHYGAMGLIAADVLWTVGRTSWRVRRAMRLGGGGAHNDPPWLMLDLITSDLRAAFGLRR